MSERKESYTLVYHFVDEDLFKAFIKKMPRPALVGPVRRDEALRNRYFPGFRITEAKPDQQQLLTAYRREILQRHNSVLANQSLQQGSRDGCTQGLGGIIRRCWRSKVVDRADR